MRIPLRISSHSPARKILSAVVVAAVAIAVLMGLRYTPGVSIPLKKLDNVLYDSMYTLRSPQSRVDGDIVIVAVDDRSTKEMSDLMDYGWPWPRVYWGLIAQYVSHCGAKAVGIDLLFTEKSRYVQEAPDDEDFAAQVAKSTAPVIYASVVRDGKWGNFAPPMPIISNQLPATGLILRVCLSKFAPRKTTMPCWRVGANRASVTF